jgi:hypothetical protein
MLNRSELARKIARSLGYRFFKANPHLTTLLNDCESVAWELERTAPAHVKATCVAWVAVKRVGIGRQFKQSIRSVTTGRIDKRSKRPHFQQIHIHLHDIAAVDAAPSDAVPGWIDYQTWLKQYGNSRKRRIAEALSVGSTTQEVARQYGVSDGRISQMRREYERDWEKFQGVN